MQGKGRVENLSSVLVCVCVRDSIFGPFVAKVRTLRYMHCKRTEHVVCEARACEHQDDNNMVMRERAREKEWGDKVSLTKRVSERERAVRERDRAREREREVEHERGGALERA